jgi:N-acetylglucosaminyldiphosphoundecaprenol N-acetyl-beta-D-mannosaminyltransferase
MKNKTLDILEIPFSTLFEDEIFNLLIENFSKEKPKQFFIATPNPEMLLLCQHNELFKKTLQSSDLNLPDGNGLIWAKLFLERSKTLSSPTLIIILGIVSLFQFIFHKKNNKIRFNKTIHGSDFTVKICQDKNLSTQGIFLLGNENSFKPDTTKQAKERLTKRNPSLKISGYYDSNPTDSEAVLKINSSKAKILFIAFGAPHQEFWIQKNLQRLPHVKMAVGIGGTFDFIAKVLPRAPKWMRQLGIEWLFRLFLEPRRRVKRIWNATIVFPYQVVKHRLASPGKHNTSDI